MEDLERLLFWGWLQTARLYIRQAQKHTAVLSPDQLRSFNGVRVSLAMLAASTRPTAARDQADVGDGSNAAGAV